MMKHLKYQYHKLQVRFPLAVFQVSIVARMFIDDEYFTTVGIYMYAPVSEVS